MQTSDRVIPVTPERKDAAPTTAYAAKLMHLVLGSQEANMAAVGYAR